MKESESRERGNDVLPGDAAEIIASNDIRCTPVHTVGSDQTPSEGEMASVQALQNVAEDAAVDEQVPLPQQHPKAISVAQWLLCPTLFVVGCWVAALRPHQFASILPAPRHSWALGGPGSNRVHTILDALPRSMHVAWELGRVAARLQSVSAGKGNFASLVDEAAALLGVPASRISPEHLLQLGVQLKDLESRHGVAARLAGALSFVNIMWTAALIGMVMSVGPALAVLCAPVFRCCAKLLLHAANFVARAVQSLQPLLEPVPYMTCLYIIGAAVRYPPDSAKIIAMTGSLLSLPAFMYSTSRHMRGASSGGAFSAVLNSFLLLVLAPAAARHGSSLLGCLAAAALFGAIGFSVVPYGLCWVVGFGDADAMLRASATAATVLVVTVSLRVADVRSELINPFRLGLSVFGAITLFLAGLIRTSRYYFPATRNMYSSDERAARYAHDAYLAANGGYLALLAAATATGTVLGLQPLSNTAVTFGVLWTAEKAVELTAERWIWVAVFGGSVALWQAALFLRVRPDWVASLVSC